MKVFRYDSEKREDRKFNNTGVEKNPNNIKFFATNMKYADHYKYVFFENGDIKCKCTLIEKEIKANLFDMNANFETLSTFNNYINNEISKQKNDYEKFLRLATTTASKKMWKKNIEELSTRKEELTNELISNEFQNLSDFNTQNELVAELKALGFEGYKTINEVAIF